jgi:hypothetical protein
MGKKAGIMLVLDLIVGAVVGYGIGFANYQPQISSLQTSLYSAQSEIGNLTAECLDLQGQLANLTAEVTALQSSLENALSKVSSFRMKLSTIEDYCVQLEKDIVFLEKLYTELTVYTTTAEDEIALWNEIRTASMDVNVSLVGKIDDIIGGVNAIFTLMELVPEEGASYEEQASFWLLAFLMQSGYHTYYVAFERIYVSTIQNHLSALTEFMQNEYAEWY